ncbi:MAG: putative DNA modification/repair radical SAM protein [Planctomycetota bacterium]
MRRRDKIQVLGQSAQYDLCCSNQCLGRDAPGAHRVRGELGQWIYPAAMPDGETILLLKVLMSNECSNNCHYCVNRCSNAFRRESFQPEELAGLFMDLNRRDLARGLFLSSAIVRDANTTMDRMLAAAEIIRRRHAFRGFIHLKVLPGASYDRVERAAELADRISINLEAPNAKRLAAISPDKDFNRDLAERLKWISRLVARKDTKAKGHTTQFVVGAAGESDAEILKTTDALYKRTNLSRAYFSAFQPVAGSPLAGHAPTPLMREHRLYQCDFLFRRYGFKMDEIPLDETGCLPLGADPKWLWACRHPECFPVEVNTADRGRLLRVPGIGPLSARRILEARKEGRFRSLADLRAVGVVASRAAAYLTINGKRAGSPAASPQLRLWELV